MEGWQQRRLGSREQSGKRRNEEERRKRKKNERNGLTLTGLLMEGPGGLSHRLFDLAFLGLSYIEQFAQLLCCLPLISRERAGHRHTVRAMTKAAQLAAYIADRKEGLVHSRRAPRAAKSKFAASGGSWPYSFQLLICTPITEPLTIISTRRLSFRPAGVLLSAIGLDSPSPLEVMVSGDSP